VKLYSVTTNYNSKVFYNLSFFSVVESGLFDHVITGRVDRAASMRFLARWNASKAGIIEIYNYKIENAEQEKPGGY